MVSKNNSQGASPSVEIVRKRHHNQNLPISSLPNELLSEVFLAYKEAMLHDSWPEELPKYPTHQFAFRNLIYLLHVCHRWRLAATSLPRLWTLIHIGPYHLEWAAEMLKLSRSVPITIYAVIYPVGGPGEERSIKAFELLNNKDTFARLRELRIRNISAPQLHLLFQDQCPSPLLETLRIVSLPSAPDEPSFTLNDSVMGQVASKLRETSVVRCGLNWDSRLLSNLTHIRYFHPPRGYRTTFSKFLYAISQVRTLEALTVHCPFEEEPGPDIVRVVLTFAKNKIKLPALKNLYVNFKMEYMSIFLRCVDVPRTAKIRVEVIWDEATDLDFPLTYRFFVEVCLLISFLISTKSSQPNIQSLRVSETDAQALHAQFFYESLTHEELDRPNLQPFVDVRFQWRGSVPAAFRDRFTSSGMMTMMVCFHKLAALWKLVTLEVYMTHTFERGAWANMFTRMRNLRSIMVDGASSHFWRALAASPDDPTLTGLKNIVIQNCGSYAMETVREVLGARSQAGIPLERLSLPRNREHISCISEGEEVAEVAIHGCTVNFPSPEDQFDMLGSMQRIAVMDSEDEDDEDAVDA